MKKILYLSGPDVNMRPGYWLYDELAKEGLEIKTYYTYRYGHQNDTSTKFHSFVRPLQLLLASRRNDLIILYDVTSMFILLGIYMGLLGMKRNVVAINFMGTGTKEGYASWKRPLIHFGLRRMKIGVNNESLVDMYARQLNLKREMFFLVKDCAANVDLKERNCTAANPPYIFMGGNTHRDWVLFKSVARALPQYQFVAALNSEALDDCLELKNLIVYHNISLEEFNEKVAQSTIVFLPLDTEIQGGQLVAFQGSIYRKPVIITRCMSIDTYYADEDVVKIGRGDLAGSVKAIEHLMSDEQTRCELGNRGYNSIIGLSPDKIYQTIKTQF